MLKRTDIVDGPGSVFKDYGLIYTCLSGWVDLGQARPAKVRSLWSKLVGEAGQRSRKHPGFKVQYSQPPSRYSKNITKNYYVRSGLSSVERESVALAIFMEVTYGFQTVQTEFPYGWTTDSGFSAENLVSNIIGFYRAVRPGRDYISMCQPVSKEAALQVWDAQRGAGGEENDLGCPVFVFEPTKSLVGDHRADGVAEEQDTPIGARLERVDQLVARRAFAIVAPRVVVAAVAMDAIEKGASLGVEARVFHQLVEDPFEARAGLLEKGRYVVDPVVAIAWKRLVAGDRDERRIVLDHGSTADIVVPVEHLEALGDGLVVLAIAPQALGEGLFPVDLEVIFLRLLAKAAPEDFGELAGKFLH